MAKMVAGGYAVENRALMDRKTPRMPSSQPSVRPMPETKPLPPRPAKQSRPQGKRGALGIVLLSLMIVVMLFAKVSRLSIKTNNAKKISSLNKQINELVIENEDLHVRLAVAEDITRVEEVAREQLAMQSPRKEQYRYVNVPDMPQSNEEAEAASISETRGIWSTISAWFNN